MNFIKMAFATFALTAMAMASSGWRSGKVLQVQTIQGQNAQGQIAPVGQIRLSDNTVYCFPLSDAGALQMYSTLQLAEQLDFTVQILVQHPNNNTGLYQTYVYYPLADVNSRQEQRRAYGVSMDR